MAQQATRPESKQSENTAESLLQQIISKLSDLVNIFNVQRSYRGQWRTLPTYRLLTANSARMVAPANHQRKKLRVIAIAPVAATVVINSGQDTRLGHGWPLIAAALNNIAAPYEDEGPFVHQGEVWASSDQADTDIIVSEWL